MRLFNAIFSLGIITLIFFGTANAAVSRLQIEADGEILEAVAYVDFGNVQVGGNKSILFTMTNTGDETILLESGPDFTSGDINQFEIIDGFSAMDLAVGESYSFEISFNPTSEGSKIAGLIITGNGESYIFNVEGRSGRSGSSSCSISAGTLNATIHSTIEGGEWRDPDTWVEGRTPTESDIVQVNGSVTQKNGYSFEIAGLEVSSCGDISDNSISLRVNGDVVNEGIITIPYMNVSGDITNNGNWENGSYLNLTGTEPRAIGGSKPILGKVKVSDNPISITNSPTFGGEFWIYDDVTVSPGQTVTLLGRFQGGAALKGADKIIFKGSNQKIGTYFGSISANEVIFANQGEAELLDSVNITGDVTVNTGASVTAFHSENLRVTGNVHNMGSITTPYMEVSGDIINDGALNNKYELELSGTEPRAIGGSQPILGKVRVSENPISITNSPTFGGEFWIYEDVTVSTGQTVTLLGRFHGAAALKGADKVIFGGDNQEIATYWGYVSAKDIIFEGDSLDLKDKVTINGNLTIKENVSINGNYRLSIEGNVFNNGNIEISCLKVNGALVNNGNINKICNDSSVSDEIVEPSITTDPGTAVTSEIGLTDIVGHWSESFVNDLVERGIVKGRTETSFAPDETINRAEIIKMTAIANGLEISENVSESAFADVDVNAWYAPYVEAAYEEGIIEGNVIDGKRFFRPNDDVIRVESLKIFLYAKGHTDLTEEKYETLFSDVPAGQWFSPIVGFAKANSIVSGYEDGSFHPAQAVTRAEAAKMLSLVFFG